MPLSLLRARTAPAALLPETVEIEGRSVPLALRRHPRARRLTLRLKDGGIAVTAPPRASVSSVVAFVERHRGWIAGRLERSSPKRSVEPGTVLPFRGAELRLLHEPQRRGSAFQDRDGTLHLLVGGDIQHFGRRVADALKRAARADLQTAVDRHAAAVGLRPKALALKDTTSRWGSCTADRRLAFSWRIVMAPPPVLDYLAAHEVAHFREMNHGAGFWALCRELCPGTADGRLWLREHGASLHAIEFQPTSGALAVAAPCA